MSLKYGEAVGKAFRFCWHPKRWLPFFVIYLILFGALFTVLIGNLGLFISMETMASNPLMWASLAGNIALLIVIFLAVFLVETYITGAIIHQSDKEKEFEKSWTVAKKRYLPLLGATIIVSVISGLLNVIPFVGWVLSIIASFAFFFVAISVIVGKKSAVDSIKESWNMFKKKPLNIILIWIIMVVISSIIVIIFMIPAIIVIITSVISNAALFEGINKTAGAAAVQSEVIKKLGTTVLSNVWGLVVSGIIALVGISIAAVFGIKLQTEFYKQFKKKRFGF